MFRKNGLLAVVFCCASLIVGQLQADILSFNLSWSGASFGNSAEATASLTLDDTLLPNPGSTGGGGFSVPFGDIGILDFVLTVTGASSGNGTFSIPDFDGGVAWETGALPLDLSMELVGQPTDFDPWGTSDPGGTGGDFNVFSSGSAPTGTFFFELTTSGGSGDSMLLTSFAPIPEPASFGSLTGLVVGLLGRRKR